MFKCLDWPCPAPFIFCFRDTNRDAASKLTFESHARVAKRSDPAGRSLVKKCQESELTFSSRGFAARFCAHGYAARSLCSNVSLPAG